MAGRRVSTVCMPWRECNNDAGALVVNGCREIQSPSGMVRQGKTVRRWKKKKKEKKLPGMIKLIPCRRTLHALSAMIKVLKTDLSLPRGGENLSDRRGNFGRR